MHKSSTSLPIRVLALVLILAVSHANTSHAADQSALAALDAISGNDWLAQPMPTLLARVIAASSKAALDEAAQSDPRAQTLVGTGYVLGISGYPRSDADAAKFYRLAAGTNAIAQNFLGLLIENGRADSGGENQMVVAAKYYRLAAEQGHVLAGANLGRLLSKGSGVKQDFQEAVRWLTPAAKGGFPQAQHELASLYESGLGVERNDAEAARLNKLAADRGNADALDRFAVSASLDLMKKGVFVPDERTAQLQARAFAAYQRDAAGGILTAIHRLGDLYYQGSGVAKNYGAAYANYRRAADHGDVNALVQIGIMTERGDGMPKNEPAAVRIYRQCAQKGDSQALTYLAKMIETGRGGLKADKAEAIRLYKLALDRGDSEAWSELQRLGEIR